MQGLRAIGHAVMRLSGLYPETITWTHPQVGEITCRCQITPLSQLSQADQASFLSTPGFQEGTARLIVHPDDPRPPQGSRASCPRFEPLRLIAWGPERYYDGVRAGALTWSQ